MVLVRSPGGYAHDDQAEDVVDRVDRRVNRIAHDGKRAGRSTDQRFGDDDGDVGDEQSAQDAAHRCRTV
jgi:hypothetical protein